MSFYNKLLCVSSSCCTFSMVRTEPLEMGPALVYRDWHRGAEMQKKGWRQESGSCCTDPWCFPCGKVYENQLQWCPRETCYLVFSAEVKLVLSPCRNYSMIKNFVFVEHTYPRNGWRSIYKGFSCQNKCSCILKYIPHIFTSVHIYFSHIYFSINVNNAVWIFIIWTGVVRGTTHCFPQH